MLGLQEVLSSATLRLVCAVLLQVLQFGGGRGVEDLPEARAVPSLKGRQRHLDSDLGRASLPS